MPFPSPLSIPLIWHPGPANGGGGTADESLPSRYPSGTWCDGELLAVIVELREGRHLQLIKVRADVHFLEFVDPETDEYFGYEPEDVAWWAKIEEALPPKQPFPES